MSRQEIEGCIGIVENQEVEHRRGKKENQVPYIY